MSKADIIKASTFQGPHQAPKIGDGLGIVRINTKKKTYNLSSMNINTKVAEIVDK